MKDSRQELTFSGLLIELEQLEDMMKQTNAWQLGSRINANEIIGELARENHKLIQADNNDAIEILRNIALTAIYGVASLTENNKSVH